MNFKEEDLSSEEESIGVIRQIHVKKDEQGKEQEVSTYDKSDTSSNIPEFSEIKNHYHQMARNQLNKINLDQLSVGSSKINMVDDYSSFRSVSHQTIEYYEPRPSISKIGGFKIVNNKKKPKV